MDRNYKDSKYLKWRIAVKKRDRFRCRMPGCIAYKYKGKKTKITGRTLQVHHIKPWSEYPLLRYDINNGITLCTKHHKMIFGKEADYEQLFKRLVVTKEQRDAFLQTKINLRRFE